MDAFEQFLFELAEIYAQTCTKQYEKFCDLRLAVSWDDCQAAYELLHERGDYHRRRWEWKYGYGNTN